jgi:hypothetical protein
MTLALVGYNALQKLQEHKAKDHENIKCRKWANAAQVNTCVGRTQNYILNKAA